MRAAALALACVALLSGCAERADEGGSVALPCADGPGAPRSPYSVESLDPVVEVRPAHAALTADERTALLREGARWLVTPEGTPHGSFEGALVLAEGAQWRLEATGRAEGRADDTYAVPLELVAGGARPPPEAPAPASVVRVAEAIANASVATLDLREGRTLLGGAWDADRPGCVVLGYGAPKTGEDAPEPASPEVAPTTFITVDLVSKAVVGRDERG